ncbi:MAG: Flp pilus assembly complex ATPase component [Deltaproteobacteria bacterium]|nr:Flp pilus assembly complex ATPase component [Deltaproteobacteria bacterium]
MENVQAKSDLAARLKTADTYGSMGLYDEAVEIYQELLSTCPNMDEATRQSISDKVDEFAGQAEDVDIEIPDNLSIEEVTHIKTGLAIGESAPEICDSATAFKELGLYKEAVAEYEKLFATDYPVDDFFPDMMDCLLAVKNPGESLADIRRIIVQYAPPEKIQAAIMYQFGVELEQRDQKELAIECYKSVQNIDPIYPKIKEKIDTVAPGKGFESRYDFLLQNNVVTTDQLPKALAISKKTKKSVEYVLMDQFKVPKEQIGKSLSAYYNCPFKEFDSKMEVPYELLTNLKRPFLIQDMWVPLHWEIDHIELLLDDPRDLRKLDHAKALFNTNKFTFSVAIKEDVLAVINHFFSVKKTKPVQGEATQSFEDLPEIAFEEEEEEEEEAVDAVSESSSKVVRLVDQTLITAYRKNVSDIHIEPSAITKRTKIRFRIDGVCQDFLEVPNSFATALLSRIKILANLDIAERRMPQDGKIKFKRRGIPTFELRVATLPTAGGFEDVVMRILASAGAMKLDDMGLSERNLTVLKKAISKPYGLILVVGPTGSGKTTTLHSALGHINTPERKIWTAEDPVEITQEGLRQVEAKNKIGLDFSRIMRAFLRADPDIIMVGEMRDHETASIGVEASLTGHLVFSTLHTNSAPETVTRLLDMGLNPLNFSDAFVVVLAQRLIRRVCKNCREEYHPDQEEFDDIVKDFGEEDFKKTGIKYTSDLKLYRPAGCDQCSGNGYKGRMGIHELMEGTPAIKKMIKRQAGADELFIQAKQEGMSTLMQDAIVKMFQGMTDMAEVRRVCI